MASMTQETLNQLITDQVKAQMEMRDYENL